jgi:hypothetical protein
MLFALVMTTAATLAAACSCYDVTSAGVASVAELATSQGSNGAAYDALNPKGRRKAPSPSTMHEDRHLNQTQRRQLIGGVRELRRNSSLVDWMVRRHLDYVASFRFHSTTGDDVFDDEAEAAMAEETEAAQLDERGVLDLADYLRMAEAMAVLDGDLGTIFIDSDTGRLQAIEADRLRDPGGAYYNSGNVTRSADEWYNGVRTSRSGRPLEYAIHRRVGGWAGFEFERIIPASNFHLHAYLHRFDQCRGVSPVASAYNQLRDIYEAEEYALVRSKVASIFAAKVRRDADRAMGTVNHETDADGNPVRSSYEVDFGRGPIFLDLDPGDDFDFVESDQPGANLQEFWKFTTLVALKALDLPYGLFDESAANFFGNKTAWLGYDRACDPKRARCRQLLNRITTFKYRALIRAGRLTLPRGITVEQRPWLWVARKMPWWRPMEEVSANLKAIGGGLTTPQRVCAESDQGDWYENVDDIARAIKYAEEKGVPLSFVVSPEMAAEVQTERNSNLPAERQSK